MTEFEKLTMICLICKSLKPLPRTPTRWMPNSSRATLTTVMQVSNESFTKFLLVSRWKNVRSFLVSVSISSFPPPRLVSNYTNSTYPHVQTLTKSNTHSAVWNCMLRGSITFTCWQMARHRRLGWTLPIPTSPSFITTNSFATLHTSPLLPRQPLRPTCIASRALPRSSSTLTMTLRCSIKFARLTLSRLTRGTSCVSLTR